jgi:hypothetical protein
MIKFTDAALYYKESNNIDAWEWLESQVDPTTLRNLRTKIQGQTRSS